MTTINIPMVMQDVDALLAFAAKDKAASMYGVALVTDKPDSPHLAPQRIGARLYFGCAENDQYAPTEMIDVLRAQVAAKGGNAEVEVYPGTAHGFAFASRPVYDKPAAERHWERLFTLFGEVLKG